MCIGGRITGEYKRPTQFGCLGELCPCNRATMHMAKLGENYVRTSIGQVDTQITDIIVDDGTHSSTVTAIFTT